MFTIVMMLVNGTFQQSLRDFSRASGPSILNKVLFMATDALCDMREKGWNQ